RRNCPPSPRAAISTRPSRPSTPRPPRPPSKAPETGSGGAPRFLRPRWGVAARRSRRQMRGELRMAVSVVRRQHINGWLFIAPALVLLGIFMIYPIVWSLWMSFQTGRGMAFSFGGLANIERLTQDGVFLRALSSTMIFLVVQVPIMTVLAL